MVVLIVVLTRTHCLSEQKRGGKQGVDAKGREYFAFFERWSEQSCSL